MAECLNCEKEFEPGIKKETCCSLSCANLYYKSKAKINPIISDRKFLSMLEEHDSQLEYIEKHYSVRSFTEDKAKSDFFMDLKHKTKIILLAHGNCKCERCDTTENLTVHHVFTRRLKRFMPFDRYLQCRYYWKNIILLCIKCHTDFHENEAEWDKDLLPLSPSLIAKVKRDFQLE